MSYIHPAALEARRKYWTRPDAYRLAPPGTPEAQMPGWLDPSMTRVRLKQAQEEEARAVFAAEVRRLQDQQDRLCEMMAEINYEYAWRKFFRKYSPNQPRDELGRWTNAGGSANTFASDDGASSGPVLSDETPDPIRPGAQYAQTSRGAVRSICLKSSAWAGMRSRVTSERAMSSCWRAPEGWPWMPNGTVTPMVSRLAPFHPSSRRTDW